MTPRRNLSIIAATALLVATGALADEFLISNSSPTAETLPPPQVEFMVWDGTTTTIAGCTEPTCFGWADGSNPTPGTGYVSHPKNNIGWSVSGGAAKGSIYLYVDGQKATSARPGRLLVWTATMGTHTLQAVAYNADGVAGWSPTLTISRQ